MATKINTDFYGAENTFANVDSNGNIKHAASTLWDLLDAGKYTGGSLEQTAAPWGMGRSSASSLYCFAAANDTGAYSRKDWYNDKGNTPMYMYYRSTIAQGEDSNGNSDIAYFTTSALDGAQIKKGLQTARYNLTTAGTSNRLDSTLSEDSGDNVNYAYCSTLYPVTYADYAKIRIYCGAVCYIPEGQQFIKYCKIEDIINNNVSVKNIVGFLMYFVNTNDRNNYHYVYPTGGGTELPVPDGHKTYYGDDGRVQPWRRIDTMGFFCPYNWYNTSDHYYPNFAAEALPPASAFDDITTFDPQFTTLTSLNMYNWGHVSPKKQVFDDVSYHWEVGIVPFSIDYQNFDVLADGATLTGTDYRIAGKLVIDDSTYNTTNEAVTAAIMHELAFIGFPIAKTYSDCNAAIGTSGILLPVFDEHWITTGDYVSGSDSLDLPNATWRDVFGATMPDYDPNYDPDPEPGEGDSGDLTNIILNRYANTGGLSQYVLTLQKCVELIAFLNGRYLPTAADLDADFKGTNPQDYIVSVQKYPFELPYELGDPNIYIGKNNTGITAKWFSAAYAGLQPLPINNKCTYDFGEITISSDNTDYCYGDFRDYQNKILLFMPFVGTADLDPRLFINHTVGLIYTIDYNTGSCVAEIKRDGLTFETHTSTISITVPFLAANMGQYQNQLAQLDYAKQLTKIKGVQTALSTAFSLGSAAQTTLAGGAPGMGQLSAITQGALQLATNATQLSQLDYQIEHTAPSVGTLSTASAANAWFMDPRARLVVVRPKMLAGYDAAQYSHVVGNACCKTGSISDFTGYTVAAAVKFGNVTTKGAHPRAATEQELQQLRRALINGAYL